jgi:acetyl esterase/lipase
MPGVIDAQLQALITSFNGMKMSITAANLPKYRKIMAAQTTVKDVDNVTIYTQELEAGDETLRLRIYRPTQGAALKPALLWLHGGGYIMGSIDNDPIALEIAQTLDVLLVSVDYRLAPEHPFPAAHNDAYQVFHWLYEQAADLGVCRDSIAVGGDSAGAGLAACLVQRIVDEAGPAICFQFLLYPMLDHLHKTPSGRYADYPVWDRQTSFTAWGMYLGGSYKKGVYSGRLPQYAVAARAEDLSGLPPTYIAVGQVDLFRDECIHYAQRLMQAQVVTELSVVAGMIHGGQFLVPDALVSQRMRTAYLQALADGLGLNEYVEMA